MVPARGRVHRYDVDDDDLADQRFVLPYGRSRSLGRFRCSSRESGMSCRNRRSGHGFTISRERQRIFLNRSFEMTSRSRRLAIALRDKRQPICAVDGSAFQHGRCVTVR